MNRIEVKGWGCFLTLILLFLSLVLLLMGIYSYTFSEASKTAKNDIKREVVVVYEECSCRDELESCWSDFIRALIWVESNGDCNAVGSLDDVGVLQIRKIIVDDCNRILGYNKYSYEDRRDSLKSVEMFNIIQEHYNPEKDLHFALKLWNSKAPISYHKKVFKKIKENEEILLQE